MPKIFSAYHFMPRRRVYNSQKATSIISMYHDCASRGPNRFHRYKYTNFIWRSLITLNVSSCVAAKQFYSSFFFIPIFTWATNLLSTLLKRVCNKDTSSCGFQCGNYVSKIQRQMINKRREKKNESIFVLILFCFRLIWMLLVAVDYYYLYIVLLLLIE